MGSSPHLWFCACKTATLAHELLVSIVPSTHLWFLHAKQQLLDQHASLYGYQTSPVVLCIQNRWLTPESLVSIGSSPHRLFCAFKTACLGPKLRVSMGPSPHVWLLDAKQRLLDWNYKALWVKDHTCCFYMQNFDFWTRITSLYESQTWPVILCMYNSVLNIRITSLYMSQPSSVFLHSKPHD